MTATPSADVAAKRQAFNGRIRRQNLAPLWERYHGLLTPEPVIKAEPTIWPYAEARASLLEAAGLITAKEAERRVLMLENPAFEGECRALETLFTGLQLIMPGEVAPAHRHTPNALRLILEGKGGYTSVNGEKTYMEYGDYVTTPTWSWHDHGHEGTEPVIWQDILDMPLVHALGPIFHEGYPADQFPTRAPAGDSLRRYGNNLRPVGYANPNVNSPIFHYPYVRTRETMEELAKATELDPYFGLKMEFIDPTTGASSLSTISTFMQRMPKGFKTERYQSTEGAVFTCVEGKGRIDIGDGKRKTSFEFRPKDIWVVPCWDPYRIEVDEDTYLFVGSDKTVQEKLGLFRERKGNA